MTTYNESETCTAFKNIGLTALMLLSFLFASLVNWVVGGASDAISLNDKYSFSIMPSNWVYEIMWSITIGLQFFWMVYLFILTLRFSTRELLFHPTFYIFFILSNLSLSAYLYFWYNGGSNDTHNILFSFLFCIVIDICLYFILFQAMRTLLSPVSSGQLPDWVTSAIRKLLIIVGINSIAFYLGWITFQCNVNFGLSLKYYWDAPDVTAAYVGLSFLLAFMIIYTLLNYLLLDYYLSKIYTIYPALIISLAGIVTEKGTESGASIMAIVLLGINCAFFIAKIVINCIKAKRQSQNYGILDYGYDMASI